MKIQMSRILSVLCIWFKKGTSRTVRAVRRYRAEKWEVVFMKAIDQGEADLTDGKGSCYTGPAFPAPFTDLHAVGIQTD